MLFKLLNLNANLTLTLGYLNPTLNNSAQEDIVCRSLEQIITVSSICPIANDVLPKEPLFFGGPQVY